RTFNGITQHFSVANAAALNMTQAITMSVGLNANHWDGSVRILQKSLAEENNAGQYGMRDDSNNQLAININGVHTATGTLAPSPAASASHLVHMTYDGNDAAHYQNGALVASGTLGAP